jgi:hypothetical protein
VALDAHTARGRTQRWRLGAWSEGAQRRPPWYPVSFVYRVLTPQAPDTGGVLISGLIFRFIEDFRVTLKQDTPPSRNKNQDILALLCW